MSSLLTNQQKEFGLNEQMDIMRRCEGDRYISRRGLQSRITILLDIMDAVEDATTATFTDISAPPGPSCNQLRRPPLNFANSMSRHNVFLCRCNARSK